MRMGEGDDVCVCVCVLFRLLCLSQIMFQNWEIKSLLFLKKKQAWWNSSIMCVLSELNN